MSIKTRTLKTTGCGTQEKRLVGFAQFAEFFHYGLDEFLGVSEFLGDHAEVHCGDGGVALAGAVDAVLADEDQGVGDAVERDGEAATVASEPLLEVLEFVVMLLKSRHEGSFSRGHNRSNCIQMTGVAHRAQGRGANLYPTAWPEDNPIEPKPGPESSANFMSLREQAGKEFVPFGDRPGGNWEHPNMRRSDLVQHKEKENGRIDRTSQIVFGERQHLLRVLDSLEGTQLPIARMQQERRNLEELIHARTRELNQINTAWDEKIGLVLSAEAKPEMLEKLVKQAPEEDYYMLRLISEHPRTNAKTLGKLAKHPYGAIRENVARHPNADANTLTYLSKDKTQPLWYLVAFNPNTPNPLQRKLRDRLKKLGEAQPMR
jgi:hypothetical protein